MAKHGYRIFDSDLHVHEPCDVLRKHIEPRFRDQAPVGSNTYLMDAYMVHEGRIINRQGTFHPHDAEHISDQCDLHERRALYEAYERRGWDARCELEAMEIEGVDAAVLFPTRGLYAHAKEYADDELAAAISRAYNDWFAEFCSAAPQRLFGAGLIPAQCVSSAVLEVRRVAREYAFKAVLLRPNPMRGRNWHDPCYDPLWEVIEEHGLAICFHEGVGAELPVAVGERFDGRYEDMHITEHVACHPVEMMYCVLCMICGGVCERFPGLRVAFLEANCSWAPYWLWRIDEHYQQRERALKTQLPMLPSEYFKRQCWLSVEPDEHLATHMFEQLGDDNVVFSTDFPHPDSRFPSAVDTLLDQPFDPSSLSKILWANTARLYGMA